MLTAEGDLRKFSDIGACSPTSDIFDETIANPNAQIVGDDMVRVQVPRCLIWLDYDKHVDSLSTMDNEVGVTSPESTTQTLPSFEEYTPPMTYPEEVEKTLRTPIELYDEEGSEFIINKQRVKPYQKNLLDANKDDDVTLDDEGEVIFDEKKLGSF
ncbi:hypothetical protein Tco_0928482 [Tanacetum coccineum]